MADKEIKPKELKLQKFKVISNFTLDKPYKVGQTIELSDKKTIEVLISNKMIK